MAKNSKKYNKKNKSPIEDFAESLNKELEKIMDDMLNIAKTVVQDYELDPSTVSGSIDEICQIHEDSPYLKERFDVNQWKKVLDPNLPEEPKIVEEKDEKPDKDVTK